MYEYLEGRLAGRQPGRVVIDVGGVAYALQVPLGCDVSGAGGDGSQRVKLWTHFVVRDDAQLLYGFPTPELRELFRLLLRVRGVGPALAMAILSSLSGEALLTAIAAQDKRALLGIKGVGKKTAEQILLDLRDRAPLPAVRPAASGVVTPARRPAAHEDAVRALVSIGYSDKEAEVSIDRAAQEVDPDDLELLVRTALKRG